MKKTYHLSQGVYTNFFHKKSYTSSEHYKSYDKNRTVYICLKGKLNPLFFLEIFICFSLKKRCRKFDCFWLSFEEVMGIQSFQDFDVDDVADGLSYHTRYLHERQNKEMFVQEMSCFECVFFKNLFNKTYRHLNLIFGTF